MQHCKQNKHQAYADHHDTHTCTWLKHVEGGDGRGVLVMDELEVWEGVIDRLTEGVWDGEAPKDRV